MAVALLQVGTLVGGFLVLAGLYFFDPASSRIFPPCLFHQITGWTCPGCGTLRAIHQLLHGHLLAALKLNPLTLLLLPFLAHDFIRLFFQRKPGKAFLNSHAQPALVWTLFGVILSFWILRNL